MKFLFLLVTITLFDIAALVTGRFYVERKYWPLMLVSVLIFGLSGFVFVQLMAFEVTAVVNILYVAISAIFVTLFYYFFFKEKITLGQWVGIGLTLLGVLILQV